MKTHKILLSWSFLMLLALPNTLAQSGVSYPYIDNTTDPANGPIIVSRDSKGGVYLSSVQLSSGSDESKVAAKLQIAKEDSGTSSGVEASSKCNSLGMYWRVPTLQELVLIWTMGGGGYPYLGSGLLFVQGFTVMSGNHWSSNTFTQNGYPYYWYVDMSTGQVKNGMSLAVISNVRCVKSYIGS